jgi:hypothetical protein
MTRTAGRVALLAVTVMVAASSAGGAGAHAPDPTLSGGAFGLNQVLEFAWRSGDRPPSAHRAEILAAADDVYESRASRSALFSYDADANNLIGYGTDATCGTNGIACFTRSVSDDRFTMWFREQGHVFDWGTLKWCQSYETPPNGCYDVENVALDEFGHILGLGHHANYADDRDYLDAVVQAVSRTKPKAGWNAHAFAPCDVGSLQKLYDAVGGTLISTCLSLATNLTLVPSVTRVAYGGTVRLTATLRIADNAAYGKLRDNLASNRAITLQRRPAGTTTWSTVGAMTPDGPGTYVSNVALTAATEFRAVFKTPTDEGLRGDTSATALVTVSGCTTSPCPASVPAE